MAVANEEVPAIRALVKHLYPDEDVQFDFEAEHRNRRSREVDCIATLPSGLRLAIEHTSAEGLPHHLEKESILRDMEHRLKRVHALGVHGSISIPTEFIERRDDRVALASALDTRLAEVLPTILEADDYPISVCGKDFSFRRFEGEGKFLVVASSDDGEAADAKLRESLRVAVAHKNEPLGVYKLTGDSSILLIQVLDLTRTNRRKIHNGINEHLTQSLKANLDEVWFMRGSVNSGLKLQKAWP